MEENLEKLVQIELNLATSEVGRAIASARSELVNRTSALLTHVSIMVAISTAFLAIDTTGAKHGLVGLFSILSLILYLAVCTFCLIILGSKTGYAVKLTPEATIKMSLKRLKYCRQLYGRARGAAFFATVVFALVILAYYGPEISKSVDDFVENVPTYMHQSMAS